MKDRIKVVSGLVSYDNDIFEVPVPPGKIRYVFTILLVGDGEAVRTVDITKVNRETGYTEKLIPMIPVPPAGQVPIGNFDYEKPIIVLEGGFNLSGIVSGGTGVSIAVWYYDDER